MPRLLYILVLLLPIEAYAACPQFFPGGQPPVLTNAKLEQRTTFLCNDSYAALASGVTHGALWSAEHLTADSLAGARNTARRGRFHAEQRLDFADQAQLDDYRRSGYDRGHMAPSGDMPNPRAQQQSFSLANMVPQAGALNRGVWADIETALRTLATRRGELYLVTGPAFQGNQIQSIGPNGVLVPTSVWKAVYDPRTGAGVYLCSNTATPSCSILSVAALTGAVGIDPFPALSDRVKQRAITLPKPENSRYARRQPARPRGLLEHLLGR